MRKLTYYAETQSRLADYCFEFIFDILGYPAEKTGSNCGNKHVDIYYGSSPQDMDYSIFIPLRPADRLWSKILSGRAPEVAESGEISFDLVSAISAFLTDLVNADAEPDAYDAHGRLKQANSFQYRYGISEIPVVNAYVTFLGSLIEQKTGLVGLPLWPDGKKCAIGLSHDIDIPEKYAYLVNFRLPKTNQAQYLVKFAGMCARFLIDRRHDEYWLFPQIIREESIRGFSSTMFFAATNAFSKWGSYNDVAYSIRNKRFASLFGELVKNGFDIGLHASYNACCSLDRFEWEKNWLLKYAGVDAVGLRHHFWHLGDNPESTLLMHSHAGFQYDSSIAFNDEMGFRRNVALPFYPWIHQMQKRSNCIQLPMFCMDGNLFHSKIEVKDAVSRVAKYVSTIKKLNGIGVIDWHDRTSHPDCATYHNWGEAYIQILNALASDSDIWVTNLRCIAQWIADRHRRIWEQG